MEVGMQESSNRIDKQRSDLTSIRGIGVVKKQWLNSLGIYTIADLARTSVSEIELQSKQSGRPLFCSEIEGWIAQAQTLAQAEIQETIEPTSAQEVEAQEGEMALDRFSQPLQEGIAADIDELDTPWNSIASFELEYQCRRVNGKTEYRTVTSHLETSEVKVWSDIETDLLPSWIRDQGKPVFPQPKPDQSIVLEITQLRAIRSPRMGRPMMIDQAQPLFPDAVKTGESFALEASINFIGLKTDHVKQGQVTYRARCIARNISTGETLQLGDVAAPIFLENKGYHTVMIPAIALYKPGVYQLKVMVDLQNAVATSGYFKVPSLLVV